MNSYYFFVRERYYSYTIIKIKKLWKIIITLNRPYELNYLFVKNVLLGGLFFYLVGRIGYF